MYGYMTWDVIKDMTKVNKLIFIIKNILYCINNNSTNIILQILFDVLPKLSKQF